MLSQRIGSSQMGKECINNIRALKKYNEEIKTMENESLQIQMAGNPSITLRTKVVSNMLIGKAENLYSELGGA